MLTIASSDTITDDKIKRHNPVQDDSIVDSENDEVIDAEKLSEEQMIVRTEDLKEIVEEKKDGGEELPATPMEEKDVSDEEEDWIPP